MERSAYIDGFNDGYVLATYRTEIAEDLVKASTESTLPYFDGFRDGIVDRQMEQEQRRLEETRLEDLRGLREEKRGRDSDREQ